MQFAGDPDVVDGQVEVVLRKALREALRTSGADVGPELSRLNWSELLYADESFFCTAFFEEQGYLGSCTNALDIVVAAMLGLDGRAAFVWPLEFGRTAADLGGSGTVFMEGAVLRSRLHSASNLLCPINDRLMVLAVSCFIEQEVSEKSAIISPWLRVEVWGNPAGDIAPWKEVHRLARLAIASEFIGAAHRIIDDAVTRVSAIDQSNSDCQSGRAGSGLAGTVAEVNGAKGLIAASWADGSPASAGNALLAAAGACKIASARATRDCGAFDLLVPRPFGPLSSSGSSRLCNR